MNRDRYGVIGNPIAHSRSPDIHRMFAQQTGEAIEYERLLAPLEGFRQTVKAFRAEGGRGANVTVPFKIEAFALADRVSPRAQAAGAANVLVFDAQGLSADNTDGIGLVRDIEMRLGIALRNASVLLLGAGGAGRGVVGPLLDAGVVRLHIANRSPGRAHELAAQFSAPSGHRITAGDLVKLPDGLDLVINATSSGLGSEHSPIETDELAGAVLAYDMVYGSKPTPFMSAAKNAGVAVISDGLGMLVEQAAESFLIWRGVRPETETVYRRLREEINPHRQNPPT